MMENNKTFSRKEFYCVQTQYFVSFPDLFINNHTAVFKKILVLDRLVPGLIHLNLYFFFWIGATIHTPREIEWCPVCVIFQFSFH